MYALFGYIYIFIWGGGVGGVGVGVGDKDDDLSTMRGRELPCLSSLVRKKNWLVGLSGNITRSKGPNFFMLYAILFFQ